MKQTTTRQCTRRFPPSPSVCGTVNIPSVSWSADWSCRNVWQYLWHEVEAKVEEELRQEYKDAIEVHLLDAVSKMTSILPRQTEDTLVHFVGESALEDFVFLHVEWRDLAEDKTGPEAVNATLDLDRFVFF